MNKAFMREPEQGLERCPSCGGVGTPVGLDTVRAFTKPEVWSSLSDSAHFCPYPMCDVVYFDMFERCFSTADLRCPVFPKDLSAPICGCFGFVTDEIDADVAEGSVTRVKKMLERAKSPEARCRTHSANGKSCIEELQKYYVRRRNLTDG